MEACVHGDVARILIECLSVRSVKLTSVGKSFQEWFAKAYVASALDAANTKLSAHFHYCRFPGGPPDEDGVWKAEIKVAPDDGSFETALAEARDGHYVWFYDGDYLLSELHDKTYARALASNPLLAQRLKVLCLMPTQQVFEYTKNLRHDTSQIRRCEAVVAGHRLSMEYERSLELEDHRIIEFFTSRADVTRAQLEMGGEDYRQVEGEAGDFDTQADYEIEDHHSFSLDSSDDEGPFTLVECEEGPF